MLHEWWRGACIYQIYPRSFFDSNNDGIGDLNGIVQKLDYIADLGVEGVWVSPFFTSPMKDFGYDVSDYRGIDPIFGEISDFDTLCKKAKSLNLKLIIDLVLSHSSDQHEWFQQSRLSQDGEYADYYVWADPKEDGSPPNNWQSVFGGPAWSFNPVRGQYYLHNFLKEQPDLNFHNPKVQEEALDVARFWLERGVSGFRLDVVNFYFHDKKLRDNPPRSGGLEFATQFEGPDPYSMQQHIYDKSQPENVEFLKRFRALLDEYPESFSVGEIGDDVPYERAAEYTKGTELLHTTYNTQLMSGAKQRLNADLIRTPIEEFLNQPGDGWPSWAFSNHDVVRVISRWVGDQDDHNPSLAKMLNALLLCLQGTTFLYQGEELGLPEADLSFEDLQDPWGRHLYPVWQGRDGCRTPMPWNNHDAHAGFSSAKPWLPACSAHKALNIQGQMDDPDSVLNFTKSFLSWRKSHEALLMGDITFIDSGSEALLVFRRSHESGDIECVFNLSPAEQLIEAKYQSDKFTCLNSKYLGLNELGAYGFALYQGV